MFRPPIPLCQTVGFAAGFAVVASFAKCLEVVDVPKFPAVTNADDVIDNVRRFNAVVCVAIGAQWRIAQDQQP